MFVLFLSFFFPFFCEYNINLSTVDSAYYFDYTYAENSSYNIGVMSKIVNFIHVHSLTVNHD